MATPPHSLFLISLLSLLSTLTAEPRIHRGSKSPTSFIQLSCKATLYPPLCYHTLSPYTNKIHNSQRQLAITALSVALNRARSAYHFVSNIEKTRGIKRKELGAVKDCIDTMGDTVNQLSRSIKELAHIGGHTKGQDLLWHINNVQTWVSAALTNENTCVDGFSGHAMDGKVKSGVKMRVSNVAQLTSNALALVNHFAPRHRVISNDVINA